MTNWKKLFREFYDDNECGGSSRWLVAPNIVEMFIDFQLRESLERVRLGEQTQIMTIREEIKNRPEWEKEFDDLWEHWIYLSGVKQQVNFNAFRDGIKSVVGHILQSHLRESRREVIEMFEILKLEVDVVICDCGSPYGDSDLANYIDEFLLSLKKQDTELKRLKGLGGEE